MLRFIILLFGFFSSLVYSEHQQKIPIFNGGIFAFNRQQALVEIQKSAFDFFDLKFEVDEAPLSQDFTTLPVLNGLIEKEARLFCRRFMCNPDEKIACLGVAKKAIDQSLSSSEFQVAWEERGENFFITEVVCTSEFDELDDFSLVDSETLVESIAPSSMSSLSFWWNSAKQPSNKELTKKELQFARQDQSAERSSFLGTLWRYGAAAATTIGPALQTWVEAKQDADLLNPNTWNLYGQLYEFGAIWTAQATVAVAGALQSKPEEKKQIYLDAILELADELVKNKNKDLTEKQVGILRERSDAARIELNSFKKTKASDLHSMVSAASSALPISLPAEPAPPVVALAPPQPSPRSSIFGGREKTALEPVRHSKPKATRFTIRQFQESAKKGKVAAQPTLSDLDDRQHLKAQFAVLEEILKYPIVKWRIQKETLEQRFLTVEKRGALAYQNALWTLAQNVMEDSNKIDSTRTLKYFYAEPGNGKTSGIEEMFVNWLGLPLCKVNHDEVSGRDRTLHPSVTGYVKYRIVDCLKTIFIEKTTGLKIRNGIVLLDDFDRVLDKDGELSQAGTAKDRENFFLLLKKLGDPVDQTMDIEIQAEASKLFHTKIDYPIRISDLYIFITANSLPPEFAPNTPKTGTITSLLSRIEIFQVPYADKAQRRQMLVSAWEPFENELNKAAGGKFVIDHELCLASLEAILEKDCEALDKMKGNMGVRGLVEFFKRFKGTIQTRTKFLRPDICRLEGNGPGDIAFNIAKEAESMGEYRKEQTENLRLDGFNKEVAQFLKESQEEINEIEQPDVRMSITAELNILKNNNSALEIREESLNKIRAMLAALNPPTQRIFEPSDIQKITHAIKEQLKYLGTHNLKNILDIANVILKNATYGGSENITSSMVFMKQEGASDLGIISALAEILKVPYCRIDGSIESLAIKTPIIWKNNQKEKQEGNIYIKTNGSPAACTFDEVRKVYVGTISSMRYIAGPPHPSGNYTGIEVNDVEWNRWTSTDSKWIDLCAQQLKKHELKDLSHVIVLIDRTKQKPGFDAPLIDALSESIEGLTRRNSGQRTDMRKATIVVAVDGETVADDHVAAVEKLRSERKVVPVTIHPLNSVDRFRFAEIYLNQRLEIIARDLKLATLPQLNEAERTIFQFINYFDQTAIWQTQEKLTKGIVIEPLREMIIALSNEVMARASAILSLDETIVDSSRVYSEWAEKWKYYYAIVHKYPIELPPMPSIANEDFLNGNWREIIVDWAKKDRSHYLEQKRLAEEKRLREEEEKRIREEEQQQKLREEERLQRIREEELRREEERRLREERLHARDELETRNDDRRSFGVFF
jgi:hypothetical protein